MKVAAIFFLSVMKCFQLFSQQTSDLQEILANVSKAQASLKSINYSIERMDTLVTGGTRTMKGNVIISFDVRDTILGFRFWAKRNNENTENIYDGDAWYEADTVAKTYRRWNNIAVLQNMLNSGSGRLLLPDLVKLDTTKNNGITLQENKNHVEIIIHYPDLVEYNVIDRKKIVTIDKANWLPVAVREHQETDGKVQDLYFHITGIAINPGTSYNFSAPPFLKEYTYLLPDPVKSAPKLLPGMSAPYFRLESFDGKKVASDDLKGKVVLIDFWEVWCGPCIESMPKIQALHTRYQSKGFSVLGITNDLAQLSSARKFAERKKIQFPLLIGNGQLKYDYQLNAVPLYVLIDRKGIIRLVSLGYNEEVEQMIEAVLKQLK